jgi:hypothetical protein
MPSLGFSVDEKAAFGRRRTPADLRHEREADARQRGDGGFVASMIGLGLLLLALGVWHDYARLLLHRLGAGF